MTFGFWNVYQCILFDYVPSNKDQLIDITSSNVVRCYTDTKIKIRQVTSRFPEYVSF